MGWKGTLRSVNAAAKRAERERGRNDRELEKALSKIDRNEQEVLRKLASFEKQLESDVIKALGLRYDPNQGLRSEAFELETDIFSGSVGLLPQEDLGEPTVFEPREFQQDSVTIKPLECYFTRWATLVVLQVGHDDQETRLKTNWYKKRDRTTSPVFIVDEDNSDYCYPVASSLTGEVLPGHPKTGIMAFENFRSPTTKFTIHFSDVKLAKGRGGKATFSFTVGDQEMLDDIDSVINAPTLSEEVASQVRSEAERVKAQLTSSQAGAGCLLAGLLAGGMITYSAAILHGVVS